MRENEEINEQEKDEPTIDGQDITKLYTLKSWYDQDSIGVEVNGKGNFRLPVSTIIQMVNEFFFDFHKARKYTYLTGVNWEKSIEEKGLPR